MQGCGNHVGGGKPHWQRQTELWGMKEEKEVHK